MVHLSQGMCNKAEIRLEKKRDDMHGLKFTHLHQLLVGREVADHVEVGDLCIFAASKEFS